VQEALQPVIEIVMQNSIYELAAF